jgi:metal-sulfur cluster biosynthetic enzyme
MSGAADKSEIERQIRQALSGVIDPEIGRNVVDIGLIYNIAMDDGGTVHIDMTTTTRGCPAAGFLVDAVRERVLDAGLARSVEVRLTYDPPWSPAMMRD